MLFLYREIKKGLPNKVAPEQISNQKKEASHAATWMRNSSGKGSEARLSL